MKHFSLYLLLLIVGLTTACKKNSSKPDDIIIDNRPPAEVVETLTEELESVAEISTFTNSLKNVSLSKEDVSQGLTIFAPLDQTSSASPQQVNRLSPSSLTASITPQKIADVSVDDPGIVELTDKELKDHIVKGVFKLADLTNGMTLTSISGKSLKITKNGNQIWINGVEVSNDAVVSDGKQTIFIVKKPLSNTTVADPPSVTGSIEVTVWDATKWAPEKSKGEVAPSAEVVLYRSQKDYADNIQAYKGSTGTNGKVKFNNVAPGTYYVVVKMGELTNIFYKSPQKMGDVYTGLATEAVFQSQADIESSAAQTGNDARIGNFKWIDINADGVINNSDFTPLPYQSGIIEGSENVEVSILIGYSDNSAHGPLKEDGVRTSLAEAEFRVNEFHKRMALLDEALSDNDASEWLPGWTTTYGSFNNFTFNAGNTFIRDNWMFVYNTISNLNRIIIDIDALTMSDKVEVLAQAKGLRAYLYMQLYTYFGRVPLQLGVNLESNAGNPTKAELLNFIDSELNAISANLPEASSTGKITRYAAYALRAKLAILDKKYEQAAQYADQVLNSGKFQLDAAASIFEPNSPEAIWTVYPYSSMYSQYFYRRNTWPYIRLTEVYLINAEAHLGLNNTTMATNSLNPVLQRMGKPTVNPGANVDQIRSTLMQTWKEAMPREGGRCANLVRWDMASAALQSSGYQAGKHNLLPIPQVILDTYTNLMQNPGY